uniref:Tubulin-specific chaperone A n=1 Tax=Syphacia muris TaxID=451379 RepID=A0A0N5AEJ2_9BILA
MADPALLKEVTIKTGVLKRLLKELAYYKVEADKEQVQLDKMKGDPNADEYMVKKHAEVLQETRNVIPYSTQAVKKAVDDLTKVVESNRAILEGTKQLEAALEQIKAAEVP